MDIAAFYTEGSNRIKVEVYNDEDKDIVVNLLNSNVSESTLSLLDTDDTRTREQKLSKFIDRSIVIERHNLNEGRAEVYFNFLDYEVSSYMIEAICGEQEALCTINTIEVEGANEQPYFEDHNTDNQNLNNTEIQEDVFDEMPGTPILDLDFKSSNIVICGSGDVDYFGGGNRYLVTNEGVLVKQVNECETINDRYSPFQLNTTIKCENEATNLLEALKFDFDIIANNVQVQKGLSAISYKAPQKGKIELYTDINVEGTVCFSAILAADKDTTAVISINSTGVMDKEIDVIFNNVMSDLAFNQSNFADLHGGLDLDRVKALLSL